MATIAQFVANTANAQLSTGPRTEQGKQTVSRNAVRHGLFTCIDRLHRWERNFTRDIDKTLKLLNSFPQTELPAPVSQSLNSPCVCGSGLKFKRCCGVHTRIHNNNPREN